MPSADPVARRAHLLVNLAIRRGELTRPKRCSRCRRPPVSRFPLLGHHEDYAKPLAVTWLCAKCHMRRHAELGWGLPHSSNVDRGDRHGQSESAGAFR